MHAFVQVVVFALGPGSRQTDLSHLVQAMYHHCSAAQPGTREGVRNMPMPDLQALEIAAVPEMDPRAAFFSSKEM